MNNNVVLDHYELFIDLNSSYPSSFHDVNILHKLDLYKSWYHYLYTQTSTLNNYWGTQVCG